MAIRLKAVPVLAGYRVVTFRLSQKLTKHVKRVHSGPIFMLVCKVNRLKNAPVGGLENGAHCWIRTNDPIGVNDVLYH